MTERYIQESLHRLMEGRTTIIIAHRLSTLSEMDRILVFKDGEIIEDFFGCREDEPNRARFGEGFQDR